MEICQSCSKEWKVGQLMPISDLYARVAAGEIFPSGECPDCGALCHPEDKPLKLWVLMIEHETGVNAHVFRTKREADTEITRFVDEWWEEEIDFPKPEDEDEAARMYFEFASNDSYVMDEVELSP